MKEYLKEIFDRNKEKTAYVINKDSITYGELAEKAEHYSHLLNRQGAGPVIIYGHKSTEMLISMTACIFAGRTYIPVDIGTPTPRIKKMLEATSCELILINEKPDFDLPAETLSLYDLEGYADGEPKENTCNEIIYIIFTSGSTGEPKGVPISKENLMNFGRWISSLEPLCNFESVKVLNQASFSFDLSVADIFYSLLNGHTLIGLDKMTQETYSGIFSVIGENKVNVMVITPTFMKMCLLDPDFNSEKYPSLKCFYFCGEMLDKKTVGKIFAAFPEMSIINAYGPTEATSAVCAVLIDKKMLSEEGSLPVGELSTAAVKIDIIDDEIVLMGKSVFSGYLNGITGGYFKDNGMNCYRTGDIGYTEGDLLYCSGRKDNQIKFKGYRIELEDIERNISEIEGIKDCAVILKTKEKSDIKLIKAFIVSDDEHDAEYVKNELKNRLPVYMLPKTITRLDKLPVNKNGKTDRRRLSEL